MQRAGIATYSLLCVVRLLCARSTYSIYFKAKYSAQHRAQSEAHGAHSHRERKTPAAIFFPGLGGVGAAFLAQFFILGFA
jgi:hypothetical protein